MCRGAVCAPGIGVTVIVALSVFKKGVWKSKIFVWLSLGCKTRRLLIKFVCAKTDMSSSFGRRKFACCIPGCNMVWLHLSVLYCTE